jgi:hypothetical protein
MATMGAIVDRFPRSGFFLWSRLPQPKTLRYGRVANARHSRPEFFCAAAFAGGIALYSRLELLEVAPWQNVPVSMC